MNKEALNITNIIKIIDAVHKIIPTDNIPDIEIRPSSIHGYGLFANEPIAKNTVITYYPINIIQVNDCFSADKNKSSLIERIQTDDVIDRTYAYTCSPKFHNVYSIFFYGFPDIIDNKAFLGHMINDGGNNVYDNVDQNSLKNLIKFKNKLAEYYINCNKYVNCKYNECNYTVQIVATKDINKDEEILVEYGASYWYSHTYNTTTRYYEKDEFESRFEHLIKTDVTFLKFLNKMRENF